MRIQARRRFWGLVLCVGVAPLAGSVVAQDSSPEPLTIRRAVTLAQNGHPDVNNRRAQVEAAREGQALATTAYLPRVDLLWQQNRATRANTFGMLLPQSVVPGISGPVLDTDSLAPSSVWGTAGGAALAWELFDFGRRSAADMLAAAAVVSAAADGVLTTLDVGVAAADAFLGVLAADQQVAAARSNVERVEVFERSVSALVESGLRPAVDGARAGAELAAARIQLIEAQRVARVARIGLREALGVDEPTGPLVPGRLLQATSPTADPDAELTQHPAARVREAAIDTSRARAELAGKGHLPHIDFQSVVFARGSGAGVAGVDRDGNGLWPEVANWAAGVTVTVPITDVFGARSRQRIELAHTRAAEADYERTVQRLQADDERAQALLEAAGQVAVNTPVQLEAAQAAERQATARYEAGLSTVTEVADAQRILAQADVDDALARLAIWRAQLAVAHSRGNLQGFLDQVDP